MGYGRTILRFGDTAEGMMGFETGQADSYFMGSGLGLMTEEEIGTKLGDASDGGLQISGAEYSERFERIDYQGGIRAAFGHQGRVQFRLSPVAGGGYELHIEVFWEIDVSGVASTPVQIIDRANAAISQYWGAPLSSAVPGFSLVSEIDGMTIPIRPAVVIATDGFYFEITVFPDSTPLPPPSFEGVNMVDFEWAMHETRSFLPHQDHSDAGRGPHEFGHMMGIPHDVDDPGTVMSTIAVPKTWMYFVDDGGSQFRKRAVPWASHFKLAKVWADSVFDTQLNREEDFVIRTPYQEVFP